ncbi:uncharacterized protein MELLADRAFT_84369 [Melampsora larici-populina 98AG31]|uniref:Uncharacterized protein n=1 Tax=Melampsora larici-populina (strain 98AG31 / pathotype 3-4-7) TaxID=747676 RepID=F4RFI6_MELLP|nr:uncharacterized protein MELLADRAFT_84369 [Melampsora larici-populina 98AG31]EGG08923.1 hypothetical protein MELLADRAFT_84369 [Melampsora larici-populina 98AG31]
MIQITYNLLNNIKIKSIDPRLLNCYSFLISISSTLLFGFKTLSRSISSLDYNTLVFISCSYHQFHWTEWYHPFIFNSFETQILVNFNHHALKQFNIFIPKFHKTN